MGFVNSVAKAGGFGLAGMALAKDKKKPTGPAPMITMSNSQSTPRSSMIGSTRGMY